MSVPSAIADLLYDIIKVEVLMYEVALGGPQKAGVALSAFVAGVAGHLIDVSNPTFSPLIYPESRRFLDWVYGVDDAPRPTWVSEELRLPQ